MGWEIVAIYIDIHVSGARKGADKPQFYRMMLDASQKKFDLLLFWALDRLSREGTYETLTYLRQLDSYGVNYRSYTEQYFDSCGLFKEAIIGIMATLAKQERLRLIDRTKAGQATAIARGVKMGRKLITEKGKGRPKPLKVETVLQLRSDGKSIREIAQAQKVSPTTIIRLLKGNEHENRRQELD